MQATVANTINYNGIDDEINQKFSPRINPLSTIEGRRTKSVLMHKLGEHPFAATGRAAGVSRPALQPEDELPDFMAVPM